MVSEKKASQKDQRPAQKSSRPKKDNESVDYKSLGSMTEEERLAYYKRKYGFEPKGEAKTSGKKTASGRPSGNTGNGKPSRKETSGKKPVEGNTVEKKAEEAKVLEVGKANSKAAEPQAKQPKKQGFFQRLFGRKNGGSK